MEFFGSVCRAFFPIASILILCFFSCHEDLPLSTDAQQINFQSPSINQENTYIGYFGFCDYFNPTRDTLIVKVVGIDGQELQLRESFTPGSPKLADHPDPLTYEVIWSKDYIITSPTVRKQSHLFYYFGPDTLWLRQPASLTLRQDQCRVYHDSVPFEGGKIGSISFFKAGMEEYLQKKVVSQVVSPDTNLIWDAFLVFDQHNIFSSYHNVKEEIYVQSPTVSAFALIEN